MADRAVTLRPATVPLLRALLTRARASRSYEKSPGRGGTIGVSALPAWDGPARFDDSDVPVTVVPCGSTLAVREALLDRSPDRWLILLTDRDERDLGDGILGHLLGRRLQSMDAWEAVREHFRATRIEHALYDDGDDEQFPLAVLALTPPGGWPAAPAGLLTRDHLYGSVAHRHLGLDAPATGVDLDLVLTWTTGPDLPAALSKLAALAGPPLAERIIGWLAERCRSVGHCVGPLLRDGLPADVVPLGLVAHAVRRTPDGSGARALLRRRFGIHVTDPVLDSWADTAQRCLGVLLGADPSAADAVLARAETLLGELEAESAAGSSNVLRWSLTERLRHLGAALYEATARVPGRSDADTDTALVEPAALSTVEDAWAAVEDHRLARRADEPRVPCALAAVRLCRWLATETPSGLRLADLARRHRDADAWVDTAVSAAWVGVDDPELSRGLHAVLRASRPRRDAHDGAFAAALAFDEHADLPASDDVLYLEDLLPRLVLPMAGRVPVLLVVADGMSAAVATSIMASVRDKPWRECVPAAGGPHPIALAVLPSLTEVSRASLLCGRRTSGDQTTERDGFEQLTRAHKLTSRLFHKRPLDSSPGGYALSADVAAAVDDTAHVPVVACVLNTIDDALDRSDPGGTDWTDTAVRHLRPLLDRAAASGRVVVLTADHGHVIERREGEQQRHRSVSSNRSRANVAGASAGEGEIRVRGARVLAHGGDAVLAVDERLRYGPLKAGYHGGGAPAEVVVPVHVLTADTVPPGWNEAVPTAPAWWRVARATDVPRPAVTPASGPNVPRVISRPPASDDSPVLFELAPASAPDVRPAPAPVPVDLVGAVLASPTWAQQRRMAHRVPVTDKQAAALLRAAVGARGARLDEESVAAALGIPRTHLRGAVAALQRLLNVDQYAVLSYDLDGTTLVVDVDLLRDQFEVPAP